MDVDIQVTSLGKRAVAFGLDVILYVIMAVMGMLIVSSLTDYDSKTLEMEEGYAKYEELYGVDFDITEDDYNKMSEEQQKNFDAAWEAMYSDGEVMAVYSESIRLTLLIITLGLLFGVITQEILFPLWLKNGQTLGKKLLGICVVHTNGVKIDFSAMLIRALLGKYVVEIMIPALLVIMVMFNIVGSGGLLVAAAIWIAQLVLYFTREYHTPVHDLLAKTAVVDLGSQTIFENVEEMEEYRAQLEAERKARARYDYSQY